MGWDRMSNRNHYMCSGEATSIISSNRMLVIHDSRNCATTKFTKLQLSLTLHLLKVTKYDCLSLKFIEH